MKTKMKCHELATALPEMSDLEYEELKQSIKENGQRDAGIVYDGQVLDGRHRYRACQELGLPFAYRAYDVKKDGAIPEVFVLDANIKRRHLTSTQRAAIGAELLDKIEKAKIGKTAKIAADATGASIRSVERAKKLKQEDPEAFEEVKKGKVGLKTASNEVAKKQSVQTARDDSQRQLLANAISPNHESEFIEAIKDGIILKKDSELQVFAGLSKTQQTQIANMVTKGWQVNKALKYMTSEITTDSTIIDLIHIAIDTPSKDHFTTIVKGWEVSVTKVD